MINELNLVSDTKDEVKKFYDKVSSGAYSSAQQVTALADLLDKI